MQVSLPQRAPESFLETQQLAWVQRTFQEVMTVLNWPAFIPPADTSFFLTTQLVLTGIGALSLNHDIHKKLDEIFHNDLEQKQFHTPFPAEIYFIAMRLTKKNCCQDDDWTVSSNPLKETVACAANLVSWMHLILENLRTQDEAMFRIRFPDFEKAWIAFLDQLIHEKTHNGCAWCGTFMLTNTLQLLEKDRHYRKREEKIKELAKSIPLSEESKLILPVLNAEISSIVFYKKKNQMETKEGPSLITNAVAEHLLKLVKDMSSRKLIDDLMKTKEIMFIDMLIQFTVVSRSESELLSCVKKQLEPLHAKIKGIVDKYPKNGLEEIYRRIFDSHAKGMINKIEIKTKDGKALNQDIENSNLERDLQVFCGCFYTAHRHDMDRVIKSLLIDYQYVVMQHVTDLANQIVELGLKTFDPKSFYVGYTKEISLLDG